MQPESPDGRFRFGLDDDPTLPRESDPVSVLADVLHGTREAAEYTIERLRAEGFEVAAIHFRPVEEGRHDPTCTNPLHEHSHSVTEWMEAAVALDRAARPVEVDPERLRAAIRAALDELGVPGEGYPAPVANAVDILRPGPLVTRAEEAMSPIARFDTDEKFWQDWYRNWLLYGTVYAINQPEPRVVPAETLTIHEGPCPVARSSHPDQLEVTLDEREFRFTTWDDSTLIVTVDEDDPGDIGEPRMVEDYDDATSYISVKALLAALADTQEESHD